jgi:UDP-2,4-diacetamido-2,4,6-trideoxy-beta-L-altropyranose hydrolase
MPEQGHAVRIAFHCNATPALGGGHVMRCLTIASECARRGADILFLVSAETPATVPALARSGFPLATVTSGAEMLLATLAAHWGEADWLVVDSFETRADSERLLRRRARRILVIDDLADRPHDCDALVDPNLGRTDAHYRPLVPPAAEVFTGVRFALLRPEFEQARWASRIRRRTGHGRVKRVLVSMGLTDVDAISARVVAALWDACPEIDIEAVVGTGSPSLPTLRHLAESRPRLHIHVDSPRMAELMLAADLAVGSGGSTSWERCALGLPTVLVILADNQVAVARALVAHGAAVGAGTACDGPFRAARLVRALIDDPARLGWMSENCYRLDVGNGAGIIAAHLMDEGRAIAQTP